MEELNSEKQLMKIYCDPTFQMFLPLFLSGAPYNEGAGKYFILDSCYVRL